MYFPAVNFQEDYSTYTDNRLGDEPGPFDIELTEYKTNRNVNKTLIWP